MVSTTLPEAAKGRDTDETVKKLINAGNLEATDQWGRTGLHNTVLYAQPAILTLLLNAGANKEAKDPKGLTPLLMAASYEASLEVMRLLIQSRVNVNAQDINGWTPIMWAANQGYSEKISMLIDAKASLSIRNNDGKTAEDLAKPNVQHLVRPATTVTTQPSKPTSTTQPSEPTSTTQPSKPTSTTKPSKPFPSRPSSPISSSSPIPKDIYTFIEGRHIKPTKLDKNFINKELRAEPFGAYLSEYEAASRPETLEEVLNSDTSICKPRTWRAYAVDEGLGLEFKSKRKNARVRIVVICTPGLEHPPEPNSQLADSLSLASKAFSVPTIAILAVPPFDYPNEINSKKSILQIASFDPKLGWFSFYDRERGQGGKGRWCYFGSSKDAYTPDTQGLGPFCGHANGTILMREPEEPWLHWHSEKSQLSLPDDHPLFKDPLHRGGSGWYFGEPRDLSIMIDRGTKAWFEKRARLDFDDESRRKSTAERVHQWISHVCLTTSIAVSSAKESNYQEFLIPSGFFFNARALELVVPGMIDLEKKINRVSYANYDSARKHIGLVTVFKFAATRNDQNDIAMDSEYRTWKVVTPSPEDLHGLRQILNTKLISKKALTALMMVDFCNPVFSPRRARLMRYIPSTARYTGDEDTDDQYELGADLATVIRNRIVDLGFDNSSPEAEFTNLYAKTDLPTFAKQQIKAYVDKVNLKLASEDGVLDYMRLAETKRRLFRPPPITQKPQHPLGEFEMMLPFASQMPEKDTWIMKPDASVENLAPPENVWHPRNSQVHFSSVGCPFSSSF